MREQTNNTSQPITANENVALSERSLKDSLKILEAMRADPHCTYDSLAGIPGISRRVITMNVQWLTMDGRLQGIGPDKGGHWEVRG